MEYFQKNGLHILYLNISSLLPKIDEIRFIAKQSNASIIGVTESKLDSSILNNEVDTVDFDVIRMACSGREGRDTCHIKKSLSYNHKSSLYPNIEIIFINIFLPKSKLILIHVLYRPPGEPRLIEYLDNSLEKSNISNVQECYLLDVININLLSKKN